MESATLFTMFQRFFRRRVLRAAVPSRGRNRTHIRQHRLVAARAPQGVDFVPVRVVRGIVDAVQVHQIRAICQHRQRFDFASVRQSAAFLAEYIFGYEARLHRQDRHAVLAMQQVGGNTQGRDVQFMPIQDQQIFRAVLRRRRARLHHDAHVRFRRKRDGAFKRHVQWRDA